MALAHRPSQALAIGEQLGYERSKIDLIKATVANETTDEELALFLYTAHRAGLDPLAKQIYAIKRKGKMTIQTGIDGYRLIADRTGNYAPGRAPTFEYDEGGQVYSATAYVWKWARDRWHEVSATAFWEEYVVTYNGRPADMWASKPRVMLAKCAEALALRRAFPAELSSLYTAEEIAAEPHAVQAPPMVEVLEPVRAKAQTPAEAEAKFWDAFEGALGGREWTRLIELLGGDVPQPETIDDWRMLYKEVDIALRMAAEATA